MINKDSVIKQPVFHGSCHVRFFFVARLGSWVMAFPVCQERMQLHEHLVEQGIAGQRSFFVGENLGSYTPGYTNVADWKMGDPGLKMYVFPIDNGGYPSNHYVSLPGEGMFLLLL